MEADDPLERLQNLQHDLLALTESRLTNLDRLQAELNASLDDLRRLLEKTPPSQTSRNKIAPASGPNPEKVEIGTVIYQVNEHFRQAVIEVSDWLELDELEAAKLCIYAAPEDGQSETDTALRSRAILRFHNQRQTLLHCLQLLLQAVAEADGRDELIAYLENCLTDVIRPQHTGQPESSAYWRKCLSGLAEVEKRIGNIGDQKQKLVLTGVNPFGEEGEALDAQRMLLARQHECLAAIMAYLVRGNHRGNHVMPEDFRQFITKASELDAAMDTTIHYLPVFVSAATYFGSGRVTDATPAHDLHRIFAAGPGQKQYKQPELKAAATICWLAEYSSRFADTLADPVLRVADRQKAEEERTRLFFDCVKEKGLHFILAACAFAKPEVWHDPAKVGLMDYLLGESQRIAVDAPQASDDFAKLAMEGLQDFTDALVTNMPDVLRRLKLDEDSRRKDNYSSTPSDAQPYEPDLERFIAVMSYAYQDDPESADDFWASEDGNMYSFLKWVSQRLPTPRVAVFCELLRSIASDAKSANNAHRFLLKDTVTVSGRSRRTYNVSWSQIFNELDVYASSLKDRPAVLQPASLEESVSDLVEHETSIMLEAYLRLASHMCRASPAARNWILREQTFHLGDVLFQLASCHIEGRIRACCFDLLTAMLTEKVPEVSDGMWVMLDNWITGGGVAGSTAARPQIHGKSLVSERHYLERFNEHPETASAFVGLLNALIAPPSDPTVPTLDALPFPENLGAPHRHAGIEAYIDFALGTAFRLSTAHLGKGGDPGCVYVLWCACLQFVILCLSSFNEDLVMLANTTSIAVDSTIRPTSLSSYIRLHPFARVMDWMFNDNVISVLFSTAQQLGGDDLNGLSINSPRAQAVLKSVQVMNLALKLQVTYFDIVRPIVKIQSTSRTQPAANAAFASFDEVMLANLGAVTDIVTYAASMHLDLSLESLDLLKRLSQSKKLNETTDTGSERVRFGDRLIGLLDSISDVIACGLRPCFSIYEYDLETGEVPAKLIQAQAVLDLLNSSLDFSVHRPTIAHCLSGFTCQVRSVSITPGSLFESKDALFHAIATCAVQAPISIFPNNLSWLLSVKRGCLNLVLKLALSPLTSTLVRPELHSLEFLAACSLNQIRATGSQFWDEKLPMDPDVLLHTSAIAIRDFLYVRELFFKYAALELQTACETQAYSVQERIMDVLRGMVQLPTGEHAATLSIFDVFDFFDLDTVTASDVENRILTNIDLTVCLKDDPEILVVFDLKTAEQLLILRKRELFNTGVLKDATEDQQVDDEIRATLASLMSQNNWRSIQNARLSALEAWTDLLSLMVTSGGLGQPDLTALTLRGLQVALPKFEKSLLGNLDSAAFLAKLTLTLVPVAAPTSQEMVSESGNAAYERLLLAFRVCLRAVADGSSGLALRDVCYRVCCSVIGATPLSVVNGKQSPSPNARHLLQIIQVTGERMFSVITEDTFSGRGSTRVSALLLLDALAVLFQGSGMSGNFRRGLLKLNFVPVLIDTSIGSIASSFQNQPEELDATLAYFHTALSLLLRICQTTEGTQLVLNSGFFPAIVDSRLFSTDPDIGLDIDNPVALKEFYRLLSAVLRVVTAIVLTRGPTNVATLQQAKAFLQQSRFSMQAVFKRTSALKKTAGPPEKEAVEVADEFSRLMFVTGFLEDDEPAFERTSRLNGFT